MRLKWVNDDHALAIYSNAKDGEFNYCSTCPLIEPRVR